MSDDLDLRGIDQRHAPDPEFRAALEHRIAAIVAGTDPGSVTDTRDLATIDLEPTRPQSAPRRHSRRVPVDCPRDVMCMSCGHVDCCDNSPHRHATTHWNANAGPL